MTDMERLRAWSDENLLASFELLVRHPPTGAPIAPRRFGTVTGYVSYDEPRPAQRPGEAG